MSPASSVQPAVQRPERWRLSARDMLRMVADGYFRAEDRVELINGELLTVVPHGPEHRGIKNDIRARLADAYRNHDVHILDQDPLVAGQFGLPEPDLAVVNGGARDYLDRHPNGDEALLVIEIAKTSQARDRSKAADYARGRVPVYWLLDLQARRLDVHTRPDQDAARYQLIESLSPDAQIELPEISVAWPVASMLP